MGSLDLSIVNVAFPALERAFPHDTAASLSWVLTGYAIVFGSLLVVAGRTADRVGSRRVFFFGLGVFCFGSLLCGVAPSVVTLIIGRIVQGVGASAVLPSSLGLLLGAYPKERRSQIVSLWGGIGALAVATGPSLGALLITGFGWRAAFFVNLPVGLVAWIAGRRTLERTPGTDSASRPDYPGVAFLSLALGGLVLAISEGPTWGWSNGRVVAGFAGGVVLLVIFLVRSRRHPEPVLDLTLFRARSFSVANTAAFLYSMGFFAMLLGNILFLTSVWHYSILRAGLAVTPGPLVVAVVSGSAGKLAARVGFRRVLTVGFVVFALGVLWYVCARRTERALRDAVAARHAHRRTRHRPDLPGHECRRRLQSRSGALLSGQRGQPDGAPDRWRARHRDSRRRSRHTRECISRTAQLSALMDLHRVLGGHRGTHLFAPPWRCEFNDATRVLASEEARGLEEVLDGEIVLDAE